MADLAVVIVSWNVRELLLTCLRSLRQDLEQSNLQAEIWVVDNASEDGTPAAVAEQFPDVRLLASTENLGFARGNNLVLRQIVQGSWAPSRYMWLLNPDTEVLAGATQTLIEFMDQEPRAGIAGPLLLHADGALQHCAFRFPGLVQLTFDLFRLPPRLYDTRLNGRYPVRTYVRGKPFLVDHPLGAAMMVRTEAVAQVGLLDERYAMYCEEIDWCWRMRRAGWLAYCVPAARVVHHGGRSAAQVPLSSFVHLWTSRAYLYTQHHGPLTRRLARLLVNAGLRQRMCHAGPDWVAAYQKVLRVWEEVK